MKTLIQLALALTVTCTIVVAQESTLIIEYNLYDDNITYKRNNEFIEKPFVRKGDNINVVITEFNPYTTKATIEVDQFSQSSKAGSLSERSYEGSDSGVLLGGDLNLGEGLFSIFSGIPGSRGGSSSKEAMVAQSKYTALTQKTASVEKKINTLREKADLLINADKSRKLALADIYNLKQNNIIRPSRIRQLMEEEVLYAFAKTDNEDVSINDLISEVHKENEIANTVNGFNQAVNEYENLAQEWSLLSTYITTITAEESDARMDHIVKSAAEMNDNIMSKVKDIPELKTADLNSANNGESIEDMAALRMIYEELKNGKSFQQSFTPIQAQGEEVNIELIFTQKNDDGEYEELKSMTQTIPVSGHWRVSGSVGVSFGKFAKDVSNFSVIDEKITETPTDDFVPQIASFVHMMRQTPKNIDLGVSLGVGLPLLNGGQSTSASFFLGPTILIGQNQRLMLTTGLMGAKAPRLSGGHKVGDTFTLSSDLLPVSSVYEIGYFLGLSFSVL